MQREQGPNRESAGVDNDPHCICGHVFTAHYVAEHGGTGGCGSCGCYAWRPVPGTFHLCGLPEGHAAGLADRDRMEQLWKRALAGLKDVRAVLDDFLNVSTITEHDTDCAARAIDQSGDQAYDCDCVIARMRAVFEKIGGAP